MRRISFHKAMDKFIGFMEVCVHEARNLHDICIYQKQDVYAKIFLTCADSDKKISGQVIEEGGQNPVFNQTFTLGVTTMGYSSSLRCEMWMLSKIRNYLTDQFLGFVSIPISQAVCESGKPAREFELSSTEVFHCPAGFVKLSFNYTATESAQEIQIPRGFATDSESCPNITDCELERIEFPDEVIVEENEKMVLEYLKLPCSNEKNENLTVEAGDDNRRDGGNPMAAVSLTNIDSAHLHVADSVECRQKDIVEMYMKGMQEFSDALAKLKLRQGVSEGSGNGEKNIEENDVDRQRVFYGSRAFF